MFFIMIVDPWDAKCDSIVGPFKTEEEASKAWEELVALGASPDSIGKIVPLVDMNQARQNPPFLTVLAEEYDDTPAADEDLPAPHPVETRRY